MAQSQKARQAMKCHSCGSETRHYRIVAHRLYRNTRGKVIAVENVAKCVECIKGVNDNGTNSKSSNE
jgi:hypothetical protein